MKKLFYIVILFINGILYSQNAPVEKEEPKEGWSTAGNFTLLFNQTAFDNWLAGGQNSIGGNLGINYDINYSKGCWIWDNKIIAAYGLAKNGDNDLRKTDDRFEFNSLVGKKTSGYWRYSFFFNFRTQFTDGFDYKNDPEGRFNNSGILKPAYLTFGPGMEWKKSNKFKFNLAPGTSKMTILGGEIFAYDSDMNTFVSSNEITAFGVEAGDNIRYELGFYVSVYHKFKLMENIVMENILNLYGNYLENPQNIDIDYQLSIVMKINTYFSTNLAFQTIYDDNAFRGFQIREIFGFGFNYNF